MGSRPKIYAEPNGSIYPTLSKTTYYKENKGFGQSDGASLRDIIFFYFRTGNRLAEVVSLDYVAVECLELSYCHFSSIPSAMSFMPRLWTIFMMFCINTSFPSCR